MTLGILGLALLNALSTASADQLHLNVRDLINMRVLVLGDSITHAGKYVSYIEYGLNVAQPKAKFDWINVGLPSETASGLSEKVHPFPRPCVHERLWAALDSTKPDIVFACYGINDGIYHPFNRERFQAFQSGIKRLIEVNRAAGAKTVILTPPPFDPRAAGPSIRPVTAPDFSWMNAVEGYDDVMKAYGKWEASLSAPDVQIIDIHRPITEFVETARKGDPKFSLSGDGVHMNGQGHWLIARTVLSALGITDPSLTTDSNESISTDPLFKVVDQRRKVREDAWLPYIGYTRDGSFKTWSVDQAEKGANALSKQIDLLRKSRKHQ